MGKDSHFYSPLFIHRKFKECFKAKPNASKNLFFFLILKTITFLNKGLHFSSPSCSRWPFGPSHPACFYPANSTFVQVDVLCAYLSNMTRCHLYLYDNSLSYFVSSWLKCLYFPLEVNIYYNLLSCHFHFKRWWAMPQHSAIWFVCIQ